MIQRRQSLLGMSLLSTLLLGTLSRSAWADYVPNKYTDMATGQVLEYNVFVPAGYDPATSYPLMVVMHAASTDADLPRTLQSDGQGWAATFVASPHQTKDPSFFLIPISQTNNSGWGDPISPISGAEKFEGRLTMVVLKEVMGRYNIDPKRLYVTGPSMGGRGTWDLIRRYPTTFAAAAPMAAPALPADASLYASQNIWSVNGDKDSTVQANRDTIAAIRAIGGNPIYTELANHGHDSWRTIYPDAQFLDWVYAQRLGVPWSTVSKAPTISGLTGPAVIAPAGGGGGFGGSGMSGAGGTAASGGRSGAGGPAGAGGQAGSAAGGSSDNSSGTGGSTASGGATPGSGGTGGAGLPATPGGTGSGGSVVTGGTGAPGLSGQSGSSGSAASGDQSGGCSVAAVGGTAFGSWLSEALALLALLAVSDRRAQRRRSDGARPSAMALSARTIAATGRTDR